MHPLSSWNFLWFLCWQIWVIMQIMKSGNWKKQLSHSLKTETSMDSILYFYRILWTTNTLNCCQGNTQPSFLIDLYNLKHLVERLRCIWDFLNAMWKIWTFKVETYFKIRIIQETVTFGYRFGSEEGYILLPVCCKYKVRLPVVNLLVIVTCTHLK